MAALAFLVASGLEARQAVVYPWLGNETRRESLSDRFQPPTGFERVHADDGSFADWLRGLPLRPVGSSVRLFDGREKEHQGGVLAVVDIDVGSRDLQQCADAVIRLRAEYLLESGCPERISFNFTSGHPARWLDWSLGHRPVVSGTEVSWGAREASDSSYRSFRNYLDVVFTYAGSHSLARELTLVEDPATVLPGDVFIQGGFPGHAVLVADVVQDAEGERRFLLIQSYMPAQDVHVLRQPSAGDEAWYPGRSRGRLETPEWAFAYTDLRRFPETDCQAIANRPHRSPR